MRTLICANLQEHFAALAIGLGTGGGKYVSPETLCAPTHKCDRNDNDCALLDTQCTNAQTCIHRT